MKRGAKRRDAFFVVALFNRIFAYYRFSDVSAFPGFSIEPNTPIISIVVSKKNRLILHPSANFRSYLYSSSYSFFIKFAAKDRDLSSDGCITSAGWNGCLNPNSGGIQSFRSPKNMPSDSYRFIAKLVEHFNLFIFYHILCDIGSTVFSNPSLFPLYLCIFSSAQSIHINVAPNLDKYHPLMIQEKDGQRIE